MLPAAPVHAEEFSTTSVLYQYAGNLRDPYYGNNAVDGKVTTITFEHFGVWDYGDNFFFVDLLSGRLADFNGNDAGTGSRIYMEWSPRVSLSKVSGAALQYGIVKDLYLAGQINRNGEGFMVEMIGAGTDLALPGFAYFNLNAYSRKDNFNARTYQVSFAWGMPFAIGPAPLLFEGYFDIAGTDNDGEDINTQPRLWVEALHVKSGKLYAGVEWFYHRNRHFEANVPQWALKWTW